MVLPACRLPPPFSPACCLLCHSPTQIDYQSLQSQTYSEVALRSMGLYAGGLGGVQLAVSASKGSRCACGVAAAAGPGLVGCIAALSSTY